MWHCHLLCYCYCVFYLFIVVSSYHSSHLRICTGAASHRRTGRCQETSHPYGTSSLAVIVGEAFIICQINTNQKILIICHNDVCWKEIPAIIIHGFFFLDIFVTQLGKGQRVLRIIAAATSTTILESLNSNIVLYHKRINIFDGVWSLKQQ